MNLKKLSYNISLIVLTLGASLIIGLLSFGGFFALWPILSLASVAFILSVAYEGEIYYQNIKGALNKLFKPDHLKLELARSTLQTCFPHDKPRAQWPRFFVDYELTLHQLHAFEHQSLDATRRIEKKKIMVALRKMERAFADHLNAPRNGPTAHLTEDERALRAYLTNYPIKGLQGGTTYESLSEKAQALLQARQFTFRGVQLFSALAAVFMGFGTTYLLVEAFTIIPFLAAIPLAIWPALIVPMAAISGLAYGLLTYNTITNMVTHDTIRTRFNKLRQDVKDNGLTVRNGLTAFTALALCALAIALTLCTAGTWWTIVQETRPLFNWMKKIPPFVMGVLTPLITGLSALAFNLENSSESLDMIEEATQEQNNGLAEAWTAFKAKLNAVRARENTLQLLNPFRLSVMITVTPLLLLLFSGHLVSIGLTANRVPGIPAIITSFLNILSEFFEDLHYFVSHKGAHRHDTRSLLAEHLGGGHGHNHEQDFPSRLVKFLAAPLYALSGLWSYAFSQLNPKEHRFTWNQAFQQPVDVPSTPWVTPYIPKNVKPNISADPKQAFPIKGQVETANDASVTHALLCPCCTPPESAPALSIAQKSDEATAVRKARPSRNPLNLTFFKPACVNPACVTCPPAPVSEEQQPTTTRPRGTHSRWQTPLPNMGLFCGECTELTSTAALSQPDGSVLTP